MYTHVTRCICSNAVIKQCGFSAIQTNNLSWCSLWLSPDELSLYGAFLFGVAAAGEREELWVQPGVIGVLCNFAWVEAAGKELLLPRVGSHEIDGAGKIGRHCVSVSDAH